MVYLLSVEVDLVLMVLNLERRVVTVWSVHGGFHGFFSRSNYINSEDDHIYFFAADICYSLLENKSNSHCVILRGENGSGKSDCVQYLCNYWAFYLSKSDANYKKIKQVFPILEAFSATYNSRNTIVNQSYLSYTIGINEGKISEFKINQFLFNKWRLSDPPADESNYLILYLAFVDQARNPNDVNNKLLTNCNALNSLQFASLRSRYQDFMQALNAVGFSQQEQSDIILLASQINSLGDVEFKRSKFDDVVLSDSSKEILQIFANVMGLDANDLEERLLTTTILTSSGDVTTKEFSRDEAEDNLKNLIRAIYTRLFSWVVHQMNILLTFNEVSRSSENEVKEITVLDTMSFSEGCTGVGFEEFLNNFTHEFLFYLYQEHLKSVSKEQLNAEEIYIDLPNFFPENTIVDHFLSNDGYLSIIEISSKEGNKSTLLEKMIYKKESVTKTTIQRKKEKIFNLKHYNNKDLNYNVTNWALKNSQKFPVGITQLFAHAENTLLSLIFKGKISSSGEFIMPRHNSSKKNSPENKESSQIAYLKNSLQNLLNKISCSELHFVACINPSNTNGILYDDDFTMQQYKNLSISETVNICKHGFKMAIEYEDFVRMYQDILPAGTQVTSAKLACKSLLEKYPTIIGYLYGKTKVFLKYKNVQILNMLVKKSQDNNENIKEISRTSSAIYSKLIPKKETPTASKTDSPTATHRPGLPFSYGAPAQPLNTLKPNTDVGSLSRNGAAPKLLARNNMADESKGKVGVDVNRIYYAYIPKIEPGKINKLYPSLDAKEDSSSDSDFEDISQLVEPMQRNEAAIYGEIGSKGASIRWFKATQRNKVNVKMEYYDWFHGIITRQVSENLLKDKPKGCFLIRVAETRLGYTLSFKAENRYRHYKVDQLSNGKYNIAGDKMLHDSLVKLVEYHKVHNISNWNSVLTTSCAQEVGTCDYLELIATQEEFNELNQVLNRPRLEPSAPFMDLTLRKKDIPPQLPPRKY